jgi:transcription antitermination factor NusG
MNYYCVACKVSKETQIKKEIEDTFNRIFDEDKVVEVLFPTKQYKIKRKKTPSDIIKPLTPGYLFIKTSKDIDKFARDFKRIKDCYGLVQSKKTDSEQNTSYKLEREDLIYATWIYSNKGNIIPSKITLEIGSSVNVISGPLATFNGQIIKVDKRNNKVCIFSENSGTLQKVWVPVEIVKKDELDSTERILKEFSKVY